MKDLLVRGEEHSKSASLPRGRAVPKAGPGFQTARGMARRGTKKGEYWPLAESLWVTHGQEMYPY